MIELHPSGGNDTQMLQDAAHNHQDIRLGEGVFFSDPFKVRSGTVMRGVGKRATTIKDAKSKLTGVRGIIDIKDQECITLADFGIDCGVTEYKYGDSGSWGILASTGNGWGTESNRIDLDSLWLRNFASVAIGVYGGGVRWNVHNCDLENSGRGLLNSHGFRDSTFTGNYFGFCGDDALGINGFSVNCTVTGNTFESCGAMDVTPAAGVKCHGQGIVITGNTFKNCHTAVSLKAAPGMERDSGGYHNGDGGCRDSVISNNTIYGLYRQDGKTCEGIRIQEGDNVLVQGNTVCAVDQDGNPQSPIELDDCPYVRTIGNNFTGKASRITNSRLESDSDNWCVMDDAVIHSLYYGVSDVRMFRPGFTVGMTADNCIREGKGLATTRTIESPRTIPNRRIGYLSKDAEPGATTIHLNKKHKEYRGLMIRQQAGDQLRLCTKDHSELVTFAADANYKDLSIQVQPIQHKYVVKRAWLEWV